jgi:hypothetical protein
MSEKMKERLELDGMKDTLEFDGRIYKMRMVDEKKDDPISRLLLIPPGTISTQELLYLREEGIIAVEVDCPEDCCAMADNEGG